MTFELNNTRLISQTINYNNRPIEVLWQGAPLNICRKTCFIVCHPHPLFEGTMHNKVVFNLAKALRLSGVATLRFNFRGVGNSAGTFADGLGERDDVLFLYDYLQQHLPANVTLSLAGFSFGAYVAHLANLQLKTKNLLMIAPPVGKENYEFANHVADNSRFAIWQGLQDEVVDAAQVLKWFDKIQPSAKRGELFTFNDSGHFFEGKLKQLQQSIVEYCQNNL